MSRSTAQHWAGDHRNPSEIRPRLRRRGRGLTGATSPGVREFSMSETGASRRSRSFLRQRQEESASRRCAPVLLRAASGGVRRRSGEAGDRARLPAAALHRPPGPGGLGGGPRSANFTADRCKAQTTHHHRSSAKYTLSSYASQESWRSYRVYLNPPKKTGDSRTL